MGCLLDICLLTIPWSTLRGWMKTENKVASLFDWYIWPLLPIQEDNGVQPEWDVCWIFACRQYHGVPYEVGRKRRTRWPLCFTDIVGLFCKCKKMKQICRLLQLSEMGKRLRQGKDTSRTYWKALAVLQVVQITSAMWCTPSVKKYKSV